MLIDLQIAIDDPVWGVRNNPAAENQVAALLAHCRKNSMPIVHVRHMSTDPASTYRPGSPGNEFKKFARPLQGEDILQKDTNSAFIRTNLHQTLQQRQIAEIVIKGVITNNSVEATARMAGNLGYRTVVVSDATFTFGRKDHGGRQHSAEVIHDISLGNLHGEYAEVLATSEVLKIAGNSDTAGQFFRASRVFTSKN